jgi:hypothetical protein
MYMYITLKGQRMGSKEIDSTFDEGFPARMLETAFYSIPAWTPSSRPMRIGYAKMKGTDKSVAAPFQIIL